MGVILVRTSYLSARLHGKGSFTNDVIGLGEGQGGGFQIMTADDGGGGFTEDAVIFYNHFRTDFCQFYYSIWIEVNQNLKNI